MSDDFIFSPIVILLKIIIEHGVPSVVLTWGFQGG